ncbi:MAG: retron system putative HNH endonuclease [Chitinophagales bacterium]
MRHIEKKNVCDDFEAFVVKKKLENYVQTYLQSKKRSKLKTPWKKFTQSREGGEIKITLHSHLLNEQQGLCIYCQQAIPEKLENPIAYSHIEHIKERNLHAHLTFKHKNLSVSCNGFDCSIEEPEVIEDFCGHTKGELGQKQGIEEGLFLNPIEIADIENFFEYDFEGNIAPNTDRNQIDQQKAKYMIDLLDLQNKNLIQLRINQLDDINARILEKFDVEAFLDKTAEKLPAFFSMLKQFFP